MRRYAVPRVVFINKLDRVGANPWKVLAQAREKLKLNAAAVQVRGGDKGDCIGAASLSCAGGWVVKGGSCRVGKQTPTTQL
jgi:elongation factor G